MVQEYAPGIVNAGYDNFFVALLNGENIAFVPGTTDEVSIDNINDDVNSNFFINNEPVEAGSLQYVTVRLGTRGSNGTLPFWPKLTKTSFSCHYSTPTLKRMVSPVACTLLEWLPKGAMS